MRVVFMSLIAIAFLAACVANDETDNGTPIKLVDTEQHTLADSVLKLPDSALVTVETYRRMLRNNEHPLELVLFQRGGRMQTQLLRGFYSAFAQEVTQEILSKEDFTEWAQSRGVDDYELTDIHAFGSDYELNGGHYALFERGQFFCIAARVGAGFGPRVSATAAHGSPYNGIIDLNYCGTEEARTELVSFVRKPKQVQDRQAFSEKLETLGVLSDSDAAKPG